MQFLLLPILSFALFFKVHLEGSAVPVKETIPACIQLEAHEYSLQVLSSNYYMHQ